MELAVERVSINLMMMMMMMMMMMVMMTMMMMMMMGEQRDVMEVGWSAAHQRPLECISGSRYL